IGLIFLMPLAGAALGAASGTLGGYLTDVGINDKWMKETAAAIQPGTAALFVLVRKVTADKVLEGLKGRGGTGGKASRAHTQGTSAASRSGRRPSRFTCFARLSSARSASDLPALCPRRFRAGRAQRNLRLSHGLRRLR